MRSGLRPWLLAGDPLHRLHHPPNRSHPRAGGATTFTSEQRPHISQDRVGDIQHRLKRSESKAADAEAPGEPRGAVQSAQDLGNGLPAELHRTIRHDEMNRCVGVPDIEVWMERAEHRRIATDRTHDDAALSRPVLCRRTHPVRNAAADAALIVEQQDRCVLSLYDGRWYHSITRRARSKWRVCSTIRAVAPRSVRQFLRPET